jgi:DNA-directed RNA polymerase specialized sigma24 family protein
MPGISQDEFDRIFSDWYYQLRNYVYYKCGDMQAAEDIVQDTFLTLPTALVIRRLQETISGFLIISEVMFP